MQDANEKNYCTFWECEKIKVLMIYHQYYKIKILDLCWTEKIVIARFLVASYI